MMQGACFEAVDRTLRDIMDNEVEPFGGKVMGFSRDHRQILPVLRNATRAETLKVCFKAPPLWKYLRQVRLIKNMRVKTAPDPDSAAELAEFSDFLLRIGEGRYPVSRDIDESDIFIPKTMCVGTSGCDNASRAGESSDEDSEYEFPNFALLPPIMSVSEHESDDDRCTQNVNALIGAVYPGVEGADLLDEYFVNRAILAPTNASVRRINELVAKRLSRETREYRSNDSLDGPGDQNLFETEFLNSLNFSGMPPHKMVLKVDTPIIMIRNLNSDEELCNGTRLRVVSLREKCIDATIMSGTRRGQRVFIPRIVFLSDDEDKEFPFTLRRKQSPVVPAFAMTINKAQGQSIHNVGIYLESPVFAHGQLYVARSRVTSRKAIKIAIDSRAFDDSGAANAENIVYREIFQ
ncbi:ATP-dependent DNA helicase PIF1 [Phytophthora citrophthora]|uniref:ATP-dependent DNA helicase n=1 Tax=Phytophthora citrophthora TaxID=4793 RepID=A0AAD9G0B9_9STRA|nr:ATP-dependent DNA helicase PIF1 [Phytophthora citrophthora]